MNPLKFYLLRAAYDWAVDNGFTPHIIVDATASGVQVPVRHVANGRIVLNIHPQAVHRFELDAQGIRFSARFSGQPQSVDVPIAALLALYARETGQGVSFPESGEETDGPSGPDETPPAGGSPPRKGPTLKIVK
jgi:stringent starvation protein B